MEVGASFKLVINMRKDYFIIGLIILVLGVITQVGYGFQIKTFEATQNWQVTYYIMPENGTWGDDIGTDTFPINFDYDPLSIAIERTEPIGFKSNMEINILKDTNVEFSMIADDGVIILIIDGEVLIHLEAPDPDKEETSENFLSAGKHNLEVQYYQLVPVLEDDPHASFRILVPGKEQRILISSGGISLIFTGIYTAFISQKREVGSPKNVIEKDIIYVIFIFIYLCLTFFTILFFF